MKINKDGFHLFAGLKSKFLMLLLGSLIMAGKAFSQSTPQLGKAPIKEVIGAMTLQEKAKIVVGMGMDLPPIPPDADVPDFLKNRKKDPDAEKYPLKVKGAAGHTHPIPRLGIPSIVVSDGPAGLRIDPIRNKDSSKTYHATAFPVETLLASSWDTSLVREVGEAYGREVHAYGVDILLAPALNIHRNPLGGRNFEYYSEDPLVAGEMTAAMVNGVESNGVGTSIKHFVANNQETNRNNINTIVSERAMREIYLKGFEIAVKNAQPWTVMSSYNKLNGTYTSQRHDLLTTILRDEWGFKGFVMTDWFGGDNAVAQMKAGNDLIMPGSVKKMDAIVNAVQSGKLDEKVLDRNVGRILNIILKSPSFNGYDYTNNPDLKRDAEVARKAAAQGMVLLKNDGDALPLDNVQNIAAFGNTSYNIILGGTGSGDVNEAYSVELTQGLQDAGYHLDADLQQSYTRYIKKAKGNRPKPQGLFARPEPIDEMTISADLASEKAHTNDVAIITIGRNAGEGSDRTLKGDYYLTDKEQQMIQTVSEAFHDAGKKVIVVMNIGGVTDVARWRDEVDAILLAWQPGQEAGHAITDVLSGKVNPSGKLATTIPMKYSDIPSSKYFPGTPEKNPQKVVYKEGIYNGYRYYDTFDVKPAYEFGYGLSYTTFSFDHMKLSSRAFNGPMKVTVDVTNNGNVPGKEVAQLYLSAPAKSMDKPAQELRGFAKTRLLKPGETQTVTFTVRDSDLASYDTKSSSWKADAGTYTVKVGASSRDIRQTGTFELKSSEVVERDHDVLKPESNIMEMKP